MIFGRNIRNTIVDTGHWICPCQLLEKGHSTVYGAMVERRDGPSWLRDDDDDDDEKIEINTSFIIPLSVPSTLP